MARVSAYFPVDRGAESAVAVRDRDEAEFYRREGVSLHEFHRRGVATGGRVDDVDLDVDGGVVLVRLRVDAAAGGTSRQ